MTNHLCILALLSLAACATDPEPITDQERQEVHAHVDRAHAEEAFAAADTDGDGKLSVAELDAAGPHGQMLASHLDELDTDGDGLLTHPEIAAGMALRHGAD